MPKAPRIFVVEDDESIRMLLEVALRSSGYTVSAFPNAADALAEMENTVPDAGGAGHHAGRYGRHYGAEADACERAPCGRAVMMLTAKDSENDKIIAWMRQRTITDKTVQRAGAVAPVCARCCGAAAPRPRRKRAAC